jgi:hypothetical protein
VLSPALRARLPTMRAEVFMVANSAAISGWLLNVEGGGWEHYTCGPFPAVVRGAMAGFCVMEDDDFGTTPSLASAFRLDGKWSRVAA